MKKNSFSTTLSIAGAAAIAIAAFVGAYFSSVTYLGFAWIIIGALLTIAISIMAIFAGFVVVKSLFLIAAELSLLIFLAQSYCAAPLRNPASDDALRSLIFLGLIYVVVAFLQSLYTTLSERYKKMASSAWSFRRIIAAVLFLIFTVIFLWEIYLVMQPIVLGLCVYR
jgi:hypothetical protein